MAQRKGWSRESYRHSLAGKGIESSVIHAHEARQRIQTRQLIHASDLTYSENLILNNATKFSRAINTASKLVKVHVNKVESTDIGDGRIYVFVQFELKYDLDDPYIKSDYYKEGNAYIYPSDRFYELLSKQSKHLFRGEEPNWNNIRTIGWVSYYHKEE